MGFHSSHFGLLPSFDFLPVAVVSSFEKKKFLPSKQEKNGKVKTKSFEKKTFERIKKI